MTRPNCDNGPPIGSCFKSSSSSSRIAFSTTGFLFGFLTRPISRDKRSDVKVSSFHKAMKPGAGSTLIIAGGPSRRLLDKLKLLLGWFVFHNKLCMPLIRDVTKEKYKLTIAFKYVGSERYSYRFWGIL